MNTSLKNPKLIAGTVTFLLAIALIGLVTFYEANNSLESDLNGERLKSEKILSEKLSLDKEIMKMKQSIASLQGKNGELDKMLNITSAKIAAKEQELKQMQKENASLKQYKKQFTDLQAIKSDLENQIASLSNSLKMANQEKESLNRMVADLQIKNKSLTDELSQMQIASLDDIRIDAFRKNKLTVSARKTKKLEVNFLIPANKSSENLQFKITDPKGQALTPNDGVVAFVETEDRPVMTASASDVVYLKQTKQIKMDYTPKKKLKAGVYRIEIKDQDNSYLGSLQVRLR